MKKIYLILFVLTLSIGAFAQCTPDPNVTKPGISPAKLPDGIVGVPYSQVITLIVPLDSTIVYQGNPYNVRIDSATVVSISDLPVGFGYEANKVSRTWNGGEKGCAKLFGNPISSSVGFYEVSVKVRTFFKIIGLPNQLDQLDSSIIDFRVVLGNSIQELSTAKRLIAYPNPVKDEINVELPQYSEASQFCIYNMMGQNMSLTPSYSSNTGEIKFNTSSLPSGMYLIHGQNNNKNYQVRFVK
jgi:hypothetical protein